MALHVTDRYSANAVNAPHVGQHWCLGKCIRATVAGCGE